MLLKVTFVWTRYNHSTKTFAPNITNFDTIYFFGIELLIEHKHFNAFNFRKITVEDATFLNLNSFWSTYLVFVYKFKIIFNVLKES